MIRLPVWLWLILFALAGVVVLFSWVKKGLVDAPKSARAVAVGLAFRNPQMESICRAAILDRELTAPSPTRFVDFIPLVEFGIGTLHARTPITLGLSERTFGVTCKNGKVGTMTTILIDRADVMAGYADSPLGTLSCSVDTVKAKGMTFRFQSQADMGLFLSWIQSGQADVGDSGCT